MTTMRFLLGALMLAVATEAYAGDLMWSGALSGVGQGLSNAASQMMAIEGARQLQQQQYEQQRARDEAAYARQQAAYTLKLERERQALIFRGLQVEAGLFQAEKHVLDEQMRLLDLQWAAAWKEPEGPARQARIDNLRDETAQYNARAQDYIRRGEDYTRRCGTECGTNAAQAEEAKRVDKAALAEERLGKWRAGESLP